MVSGFGVWVSVVFVIQTQLDSCTEFSETSDAEPLRRQEDRPWFYLLDLSFEQIVRALFAGRTVGCLKLGKLNTLNAPTFFWSNRQLMVCSFRSASVSSPHWVRVQRVLCDSGGHNDRTKRLVDRSPLRSLLKEFYWPFKPWFFVWSVCDLHLIVDCDSKTMWSELMAIHNRIFIFRSARSFGVQFAPPERIPYGRRYPNISRYIWLMCARQQTFGPQNSDAETHSSQSIRELLAHTLL